MKFRVDNMTCNSCVKHITQAITAIDPKAKVEADTAVRQIAVTTVANQKDIEKALADEGYAACAI